MVGGVGLGVGIQGSARSFSPKTREDLGGGWFLVWAGESGQGRLAVGWPLVAAEGSRRGMWSGGWVGLAVGFTAGLVVGLAKSLG